MEQRIFGCVRREIADLVELKQVGYERNARCNALTEQGETGRQKNKPTDQIGDGQHDQERRKYSPNPPRVKLGR